MPEGLRIIVNGDRVYVTAPSGAAYLGVLAFYGKLWTLGGGK